MLQASHRHRRHCNLLAMQNRVHDYVVAGKGTPNAALDALLKDWTEVFKEDGKLK